MKIKFFLLLFLIIGVNVFAQTSFFEKDLYCLEDVIFEKIKTSEGFESTYKLFVKQPLDHKDASKGYFYQKVYLNHKGYDRPVVFITEGYESSGRRIYELSQLLDANQVEVEHRYFGESIPDSINYDYLTLEQETADLHHVNELMREIYNGKFIATGISKGGQTTIFYRYFYPDDVTVSVPYVAPINLSREDTRIYEFFDKVGTKECREDILNFQKRILSMREEALLRLKWFYTGERKSFHYMDFQKAFEYAVLEYQFSFWQSGIDCQSIPDDTASVDEMVFHLLTVSGLDFFSDQSMERLKSHYYMAAHQMGYYAYETEDFDGLLKALPMKPHPSAIFTPDKMEVPYDSTLSIKVYNWVKDKGDRFIYINGGIDTWSSTAIPVNKKRDALWYFLDGRSHYTARIASMNDKERKQMVDKLEEWLQMEIE
jgi:PS-10 peptidase S37